MHCIMDELAETSPSYVAIETRNRIKQDYALGKGSISRVSEAYGVNPKTAIRWADNEKWTTLRTNYAHFQPVLKLIDQINDVDRKIDELIGIHPVEPLGDPDAGDGEDYAKNLDCLCRSKQRLFSMLWGITGHPKPPTAKAPKERNVAKEKMLKALSAHAESKPKKARKIVDQAVNTTPDDDSTLASTDESTVV